MTLGDAEMKMKLIFEIWDRGITLRWLSLPGWWLWLETVCLLWRVRSHRFYPKFFHWSAIYHSFSQILPLCKTFTSSLLRLLRSGESCICKIFCYQTSTPKANIICICWTVRGWTVKGAWIAATEAICCCKVMQMVKAHLIQEKECPLGSNLKSTWVNESW